MDNPKKAHLKGLKRVERINRDKNKIEILSAEYLEKIKTLSLIKTKFNYIIFKGVGDAERVYCGQTHQCNYLNLHIITVISANFYTAEIITRNISIIFLVMGIRRKFFFVKNG